MAAKLKILMAVFLIFLAALPLSSAKFVCGIVNDTRDYSASWISVRAYFPSKPQNYVSCKVSPENNKYCCDIEEIPPRNWKVGNIVAVRVFDENAFFSSDEVRVKTTGEGYDVAPPIKLKKALEINSPKKHLFVLKNPQLFINITSSPPFNNLSATGPKSKLSCNACNNLSGFLNLSYGENELIFSSSSPQKTFKKKLNTTILSSASISRRFVCPSCKGFSIGSGEKAKVEISLSLSPAVSSKLFREFVPASWKILDANGGEVKPYSKSHKVIEWNVSGKKLNISYLVKAPVVGILPKAFFFWSSLQDYTLPKSRVLVHRLFRFLSSSSAPDIRKNIKSKSYSISKNEPLVIKKENLLFAFYPKNSFSDAKAKIKKESSFWTDYYYPQINLEENQIEKVLIKVGADPSISSITAYTPLGIKELSIGKNGAQETTKGLYYLKVSRKKPIFLISVILLLSLISLFLFYRKVRV
ncbi:hypothetical protein D6829_02420 [Candidatus Pacearchaeota archaeon]|nr:MAG: hypothetical protein D6829_02420 [Candidatus Pacearchaeota archaeon]